jgi:hypothetical protein
MQMQEEVPKDEGRTRSVGEMLAASESGFSYSPGSGTEVFPEVPQSDRSRRRCFHTCTFVPAGTVVPSSTISVAPVLPTFSHERARGAGPLITDPSAAKVDP